MFPSIPPHSQNLFKSLNEAMVAGDEETANGLMKRLSALGAAGMADDGADDSLDTLVGA